jgi:hypothetical protein
MQWDTKIEDPSQIFSQPQVCTPSKEFENNFAYMIDERGLKIEGKGS